MPSPSPRRLVLLGATGAVGRNVLAEALRSPAFEAVTTLGRRTADIADGGAAPGKLAQHVVDLEAPASYRSLIERHTAAICTLGVRAADEVDEGRSLEGRDRLRHRLRASV